MRIIYLFLASFHVAQHAQLGGECIAYLPIIIIIDCVSAYYRRLSTYHIDDY
jgi:hypothetical protein